MRFVRILVPDPSGEPGGRIRVEYDPDNGVAILADEDVLGERAQDPDARRVRAIANVALTTSIVAWLSDVLRELAPVMSAHDAEIDRRNGRVA